MLKHGFPVFILTCLLSMSLTAGAAQVGLGSYADVCPPGQRGPQRTIYKTAKIQGATPTNEWWSSVIWSKFSENMYPHPITVKCGNTGFELGNPKKVVEEEDDGEAAILMQHRADLEFGGVKWLADDARLDAYGDWSATFILGNGKSKTDMRVTAAHGSPFVFITYTGIQPLIKFRSPGKIWFGNTNSQYLGVTINGSNYGIFAPAGSKWVIGTNQLKLLLPKGKNYLSAALLPNGDRETLNFFKNHAYAFITDTRVDWSYDQKRSSVMTNFTITTTVHEGTNNKTIIALYPHQWRNNHQLSLLPYTYDSIRGKMKVIEGNTFTTTYAYHGILPWLPDLGDYDRSRLQTYVQEVHQEGDHIRSGPGRPGIFDPYTMGKNLSRLATILPIAEQLGDQAAADDFYRSLADAIQDYLTATPEKSKHVFYYDQHWGTLLGFPAGFGSDMEMNDHHFHYGYFTYAAAALALRDKNWGRDSQWGGMIKELIRDMANWDRNDNRYPFLRNFDPYEGHSWASGTAKFADGNNQESSSEAINAWVALILWGEATGNKSIRDLGIYLYTTEVTAAQNYWFDIHGDVFPPEYQNTDSSIVWGGKIVHTTWWTEGAVETKAINFMPITGGSLYLGYDPDYVLKNYGELAAKVNRIGIWPGLVYSYLALADPEKALDLWNPSIGAEFGDSNARIYHWICSLKVMGRVDTTVTADTPLYAVFNKNGVRTYVAYNATDQETVVEYSDGTKLQVPSHQMATLVK